MYIALGLILFLVVLTRVVISLPVFGRLPGGNLLERIRQLPNYEKGALQNISYTPMIPDDVTYWKIFRAMIKGNPNRTPSFALPHITPDLKSTAGHKITWFGHSSYLLQLDALKVLVDPIFSSSPSPFSFIGTKNFEGTDFMKAAYFSQIDVLLITHDHYDHLDYQSILELKGKVKHIVTSAGVGAHLERWGIPADNITELAWGEQTELYGLKFTATPARHFTGRVFKRNQTLWSAFILETPVHKLYLGGDSGYDSHFKKIGEQYGPFDMAILECGQYDNYWRDIHMFPEQTVQAAKDLKAKVLMPVHWGKFSLALHDWDDAILRVHRSAEKLEQQISTPVMGELVNIDGPFPSRQWWLKTAKTKQ